MRASRLPRATVPLLINASIAYYTFALYLLRLFHLITESASLTADYTPVAAFNIAWTEVVSFAFSVALLVFLVVRTIRLARYRAFTASEMQAVKTLQGLLLARSQQATPGYAVETVYRPASEVGGDFFLVSPGADGSMVAIVGDVSGKGLLAAMRISLILGALNRESSRAPAEVLGRLNQVLLGQGDMGFTTACCVRVEANGDYKLCQCGAPESLHRRAGDGSAGSAAAGPEAGPDLLHRVRPSERGPAAGAALRRCAGSARQTQAAGIR